MRDWEKCDGYVRDSYTALVAMALSSIVSIMLLIFIERLKLLFYQASETKYEGASDLHIKDPSKYLQTRNL